MKHIKKFENFEDPGNGLKYSGNYNIGDHVLLDMKAIKHNNIHEELPSYDECIITDYGDYHHFYVEFIDDTDFAVDESEIIRKLTPDEIDIYDIKNDATKYNL